MEFSADREFKDTEESHDARRLEHQPLWKALRNVHTASEWLAGKLKMEPQQVHITRSEQIEENGKKKVLLEGVTTIDGDILRLSIKVDGEKPFQTNS